MSALTIAFDTIVVGALALPWAMLLIHLFIFNGECRFEKILDWVKQQNQAAAAGVLLFAITYTLGSAVSRIAEDFFNDDDLHILLNGRIVSTGITEDRLVIKVYCQNKNLLPQGRESFIDTDRWMCEKAASTFPLDLDNGEKHQKHAVDIFHVQESALLLKGEDDTQRLRQLHDQIMVLRGATFNGFVAFSLGLFAWCARAWGSKSARLLRWGVALIPCAYIAAALIALSHHVEAKGGPPIDPPYMEFTLLLLGGAGLYLLWKKPRPREVNTQDQAKAIMRKQNRESTANQAGQAAQWGGVVILAFLLTFVAFLGWWSTEVIYDNQVIYSSYAAPSQSVSPK